MKPTVYIPELHDRMVIEGHTRWKLSRYAIADRLGLPHAVVKDEMKRLKLKPHKTGMPQHRPQKEPKPPKEQPNPLAVATVWLRGRFVEKPSGFWLDGIPVSLTTLMRATNAAIRKAGSSEEIGPPHWRVP